MSDEEAKPEAGTTIAQSNSLADRAARIRAEYEAAGQAEDRNDVTRFGRSRSCPVADVRHLHGAARRGAANTPTSLTTKPFLGEFDG